MRLTFSALLALALATLGPISALAADSTSSTPKIEPKIIVVAGWENGADSGDAPGEYQDWVERYHLDETVPVHGLPQLLRRNSSGVYGLVLKYGTGDLEALALDDRFDLSHTYWIFTGISGVDPNAASVGSVAWARWVVDADALRELDDRATPASWPYGLYAIGADAPNKLPADPNHYGSVTDASQLSKAYALNPGLTRWAYNLSLTAKLSDDARIATRRAAWKAYPKAQLPPFVLLGETLGALRYWHGAERTRWAEDWVRLWTGGKGLFVMTNEESQSNQLMIRLLASRHLVDPNRVLVLRSASNFCMPAPNQSAADSMGDEEPGQVLAFDNNERAARPVIEELLRNWSSYRNQIPSAPETTQP